MPNRTDSTDIDADLNTGPTAGIGDAPLDDKSQQLLAALVDLGEATAGALAEQVGIAYSTTTPKLRKLHSHGLAEPAKAGNGQIVWRLTEAGTAHAATARAENDTAENHAAGSQPAGDTAAEDADAEHVDASADTQTAESEPAESEPAESEPAESETADDAATQDSTTQDATTQDSAAADGTAADIAAENRAAEDGAVADDVNEAAASTATASTIATVGTGTDAADDDTNGADDPTETAITGGDSSDEGEDPNGENPNGEDPNGEDPNGEDPNGEDPNGEDPNGTADATPADPVALATSINETSETNTPADTGPTGTDEATGRTEAAPAGGDGAAVTRRAPGSLDKAILSILQARPDEMFTVGELCRLIDKAEEGAGVSKASAGAVVLAAQRLVARRQAILAVEKPTSFQYLPGIADRPAPVTQPDAAQAVDAVTTD